EWRHADFSTGAPTLSGYDSGDWTTAGLSTSYAIADSVRFEARGYARRGHAAADYHDFKQWGAEAALSFQVPPPSAWIVRNWTITPFTRVTRTTFDAPNPFVDPLIARADTQWSAGVLFDTPLTKTFGISTLIQY